MQTKCSNQYGNNPSALNNVGTVFYADGAVPVSEKWTESVSESETLYYDKIHLGRENIAKISVQDASKLNLTGITYDTVDNFYEFSKLQDAINACKDNNEVTIFLKREITLSRETTVTANKQIILDLNGSNLFASTENAIYNKGTLQIKDSDNSATVSLTEAKSINNEGTLTLTDLKANLTKAGTNKNNLVVGIKNSGNLNINGTYSSTNTNANKYMLNSKFETFIENSNTGKVVINNADCEAAWSIYTQSNQSVNFIKNYGECTVNNSKILGENIVNENPGIFELNGSYFGGAILNNSTKTVDEAVANSKPAVKLYNSEIYITTDSTSDINSLLETPNDPSHIINNAGELIIDGENTRVNVLRVNGIYNSSSNNVIRIDNHGTDSILRIKNGELNAHIFNYGTYTHENATVHGGINNSGGLVDPNNGNSGYNGTGTVDILSGEFNDSGNIAVYTAFTTGFLNAGKGTINIGSNDGTVNTDKPLIDYSNKKGRYDTGIGSVRSKLNFYDGTIKMQYNNPDTWGRNLDGKINEIAPNSTFKYETNTETGIRTYWLEVIEVAQIGNTKYIFSRCCCSMYNIK